MIDGLSSSENLGSLKGLVDVADLPGILDGFLRLWAPHRVAYASGATKLEKTGEYPFCVAPSLNDVEALIVVRGHARFVLLNLHPYNSGYILVCTYRRVSLYTDLTDEERVKMGSMAARVMEALGEVLQPADFNLGMNRGDITGAGIVTHIYQYAVPRWFGDANFLPIIAQTKATPTVPADTRNLVSETRSRTDHGSTGEGSMRGDAMGRGPAREDPAGEERSRNAQ